MPIYVFKCEECEKRMEKLQNFGSYGPKCCGKSMIKQPTSPALVVWKGAGGSRIYSDGYKDRYAKGHQKRIEEERN